MNTPDAAAADTSLQALGDDLFVVTAEERSGSIEVSVNRSIREMLQVVRDQMSLDVVFIGEIVNDRRVFRYVDAASSAADRITEGQSAPLDETLCQRILDGRLPPVIPDVSSVVASQGLPANFLTVGTYIGVPVRLSNGTVYGFLCGFNVGGGTCELGERDVRRLEIAASAAARLLECADGHHRQLADPALV